MHAWSGPNKVGRSVGLLLSSTGWDSLVLLFYFVIHQEWCQIGRSIVWISKGGALFIIIKTNPIFFRTSVRAHTHTKRQKAKKRKKRKEKENTWPNFIDAEFNFGLFDNFSTLDFEALISKTIWNPIKLILSMHRPFYLPWMATQVCSTQVLCALAQGNCCADHCYVCIDARLHRVVPLVCIPIMGKTDKKGRMKALYDALRCFNIGAIWSSWPLI